MPSERDPDDLKRDANTHDQRANELDRESAQTEPTDQRFALQHESSRERSEAQDLNRRAEALTAQNGLGRGEAEEAERQPERRAWTMPGTTAEDSLQQLREASDAPSLMTSLATYSTRSLMDRDGAAYGAVRSAVSSLTPASRDTPDKTETSRSTDNDRAADLVSRHTPSTGRDNPTQAKGIER